MIQLAHTLGGMGSDGKPGRVAANLKRLLKELDLGPTELSRRSQVPRSTINSLLRGEAGEPRADTLAKLAKGLDVPEAELHSDRAGTADVEDLIKEFSRSRAAASLEPAFSDRDAMHLRQEGKYTWKRKRPTPRAIRRLVLYFRALYDEDDRSE